MTTPKTASPDIIGVLRSVHSALDGALGDTDVSHIENDDELRDAHPVQWAAAWLMHAIEAMEEPTAAPSHGDCDVRTVDDAMVERAWSAIVGADVAGICFTASLTRGDLRTGLEAALALPSADRVPKVRTSHHRNKEEAARLQAIVDEKYAASTLPSTEGK